MIRTVILELPSVVPLLESISATLWPDMPMNQRRIASTVTYMLNELIEDDDIEKLEYVTSTDVDMKSVRGLLNDIVDMLGAFLTKHNIQFGICTGIIIQNATGVVILNFGVK